jgi:hypothetical protein
MFYPYSFGNWTLHWDFVSGKPYCHNSKTFQTLWTQVGLPVGWCEIIPPGEDRGLMFVHVLKGIGSFDTPEQEEDTLVIPANDEEDTPGLLQRMYEKNQNHFNIPGSSVPASSVISSVISTSSSPTSTIDIPVVPNPGEAPVDCVIVVLSMHQQLYAESVAKRLATEGLQRVLLRYLNRKNISGEDWHVFLLFCSSSVNSFSASIQRSTFLLVSFLLIHLLHLLLWFKSSCAQRN